MAESPLRRPHSRASSNGSSSTRYELDVDALLHENDDDSVFTDSIAPRDKAIDMILSEDIDGPTDFTQNMEFWMRGGHISTLKKKKDSRGQQTTISERMDAVQGPGNTNTQNETHVVNIAQTTAFAAGELKSGLQLEHTPALLSPKTKSKATVRSDMVKLNGQEVALESKFTEDSSHLAPPKSNPPPHLEKYKVTPTRPRPTRSASSSALGDTLRRSIALELKHMKAQQGSRLQNAPLRDDQNVTLEGLQQELSQSKSETKLYKDENAALRSQLREQELKNEGLRQTLNYQVSTAKRKSDDRLQSLNRQMDELRSKCQTDLEQQRTSYEAQIASYGLLLSSNPSQPRMTAPNLQMPATSNVHTQIQTLESQLCAATATIASLRTDLTHSQEAVRILRLEARESQHHPPPPPAAQTAALQAQIADLREQLRATEIERDLAETAREDLEERADALEARMEASGGSGGAAAAEARLRGEGAALRRKVDDLEEQVLAAEERVNELERESAVLEEERESAWGEARAAREKVLELTGEMKQRTAKEVDALRHELSGYETLLRQQKDQAEAAREQSRLATEEAAKLRAEFNVVSAAMDRKVKEIIDARDVEWVKKIQLLDKDRQVMAKVLLREWGRAELGKTAPQVYRYRYAV